MPSTWLANESLDELAQGLDVVHQLALSRYGHLSSLPTLAAPSSLSSALTALPSTLPDQGLGLSSTLSLVSSHLLPSLATGHSASRYFGFVTGGILPSAHIADNLVTLLDQNVQVHLPSETHSTLIEAYTVKILLSLLSLDEERWTGTLTTGATSSNILGLACGREKAVRNVMAAKGHKDFSLAEEGFGPETPRVRVFTARSHASVGKAAAIVGIGRRNVVDVARSVSIDATTEDDEEAVARQRALTLELDLVKLETALKECKERGEAAVVVVGLGEVNTGALTNQVPELRRLCDEYGAWLHVDAAFSAFMTLLPGYEWISSHLDMADSITSDAHKQLNVPYDCGLFFIRKAPAAIPNSHSSPLDDVCGIGKGAAPAYLAAPKTAQPSGEAEEMGKEEREKRAYLESLPSPLHRNLENSRRFRALPLYLSLLSQGRAGYASLVSRNVSFARGLERWMRTDGVAREFWKVLTPLSNSASEDDAEGRMQPWTEKWGKTILLFTLRDRKGDVSDVVRRVKATRLVYVTPTTYEGVPAIRLAVSNWSTGLEPQSSSSTSDHPPASVAQDVTRSRDFAIVTHVLRAIAQGLNPSYEEVMSSR